LISGTVSAKTDGFTKAVFDFFTELKKVFIFVFGRCVLFSKRRWGKHPAGSFEILFCICQGCISGCYLSSRLFILLLTTARRFHSNFLPMTLEISEQKKNKRKIVFFSIIYLFFDKVAVYFND